MNPAPGVAAMQGLARLGYQFVLNGDALKAVYEYLGDPEWSQVAPCFSVLNTHKAQALDYLTRKKISRLPDRPLTCADCLFHNYQGPNPRQGWGQCSLKDQGCYGLKAACEDFKRPHSLSDPEINSADPIP